MNNSDKWIDKLYASYSEVVLSLCVRERPVSKDINLILNETIIHKIIRRMLGINIIEKSEFYRVLYRKAPIVIDSREGTSCYHCCKKVKALKFRKVHSESLGSSITLQGCGLF